jgi:3-phenylpropionate/trans-cinnamate dioxygenase ferredoxin reductase component
MADNADRTFVVIGASVAGGKAVETLRAEGFAGRIVLVGEETERPYERPPLSKGVLLGNDEPSVVYLHEQGWYDEQKIELKLGVRAERIDPAGHQVTLSDGSVVGYDKLLLATGSSVRRLTIPGGDLAGVHYLRTLGESLQLQQSLSPGRRVVVVGAGWIGLETAAAARSRGAEVVVLEMQPGPLHSVVGAEIGEVFANLHRDHGVDLRFGDGVAEFEGDGTAVTGVGTTSGATLPADVVIVGVGIAPNTELAQAAGLTVDNGVVTDARLRTSDPDIYAAGDVARWQSPLFGRGLRVEHWANANDGGPAAARSMLGGTDDYDVVPFFFSDQYDLGLEYAGDIGPDGYDEVVVRGDLKAREFVALWVRSGCVVAGMNANVWDVQDDIQALIRAGRAGKQVDRAKLADAGVPLGDLVG